MNTRYADMVAPTGGYVYACRAGLDLGRRRGVAFGRAGRPDKTTAHPVPSRPVVEYQHARARRPPGNTARPRMAPPPAGMGTRRRRRARRLLALRQAHPTRTTVGPRTPHTTRARRHRRHRCTRAPATVPATERQAATCDDAPRGSGDSDNGRHERRATTHADTARRFFLASRRRGMAHRLDLSPHGSHDHGGSRGDLGRGPRSSHSSGPIMTALSVVAVDAHRCGHHHRLSRDRCRLVRGHAGPHRALKWPSAVWIEWR
jgi:hypothetical protein